MRVAATVHGETLVVTVDDDGCGPCGPSRRPGLGWGWKLIADATDQLTVAEREAGGTRVVMHFRLACHGR
jgi:hypothetical protein